MPSKRVRDDLYTSRAFENRWFTSSVHDRAVVEVDDVSRFFSVKAEGALADLELPSVAIVPWAAADEWIGEIDLFLGYSAKTIKEYLLLHSDLAGV